MERQVCWKEQKESKISTKMVIKGLIGKKKYENLENDGA